MDKTPDINRLMPSCNFPKPAGNSFEILPQADHFKASVDRHENSPKLNTILVPAKTTHFKDITQKNILGILGGVFEELTGNPCLKNGIKTLLDNIENGMFNWEKASLGKGDLPSVDYALNLRDFLVNSNVPLFIKDEKTERPVHFSEIYIFMENCLKKDKPPQNLEISYADETGKKLPIEDIRDLEAIAYIHGSADVIKFPRIDVLKELNKNGVIFTDDAENRNLGLYELAKRTGLLKDNKPVINGLDINIEKEGIKSDLNGVDDMKALSYLYCEKNKADISGMDEEKQNLLKCLELSKRKGLLFLDESDEKLGYYGAWKKLKEEKNVFIDINDKKNKVGIKNTEELFRYLDSIIYPTSKTLLETYGLKDCRVSPEDNTPEKVCEIIQGIVKNPDNKLMPLELAELYRECYERFKGSDAVLNLIENLNTHSTSREIFVAVKKLITNGGKPEDINMVLGVQIKVTGQSEIKPSKYTSISPDGKNFVEVKTRDYYSAFEKTYAVHVGEVATGKELFDHDILNAKRVPDDLWHKFSPDGKNVLVSFWGSEWIGGDWVPYGGVRLYDAKTGSFSGGLFGPVKMYPEKFSPDSKKVLFSTKEYVGIFDLEKKVKVRWETKQHYSKMESCEFSLDSKFAAVIEKGYNEHYLRVFNTDNGKVLLKENFEGAEFINSLAFSDDNKNLAVGDSNGCISILDLKTGKTLLQKKICNCPLDSCKFLPDGKHIVAGNSKGVLTIIDARTGEVLQKKQLDGSGRNLPFVECSANGRSMTVKTAKVDAYYWSSISKYSIDLYLNTQEILQKLSELNRQ